MCPRKTVFFFLLTLAFCVSSYPQKNRVKLYVPYKQHVVHKHHLKRVPVPVPVVKHVPIVKTVPVYKTVEVPVYQHVQIPVPVYIPGLHLHHKYTSQPEVQEHNPWSGNKYSQWVENSWDNNGWSDQSHQTGYHHVYEPYQVQQTYVHSTPNHYAQEEFYPISSHQTADVHYSDYPMYDQWKGIYSTEMRRMSNDQSEVFRPVETQSHDELPYTDRQVYEHSTALPTVKVTNYHAQDSPKEHDSKKQITDHQVQDQHYADLAGRRNPNVVISQAGQRGLLHITPVMPKYQGSHVFDQHIHDRDRKAFPMTDNVATQ